MKLEAGLSGGPLRAPSAGRGRLKGRRILPVSAPFLMGPPYISRGGLNPVPRDPVSISIATAAAFTQATGIILSFEAFAALSLVTSAAVTIGTSFAISAAATALSNTSKQSTLAGGQGVSFGDQGLRLPVRQPIPPQWLVLGEVMTSGKVLWGRDKRPYIWIMYELGEHECGDFLGLTINGQNVPLEDPGTGIMRANSAPFFDGTTRYIELAYRNGAPGQEMCPIVARDITDPAPPSTFRQRLGACITLKAHYGANDTVHKEVYGDDRAFNPLFRYRGAKVPDPRAAEFDPHNPATWVQSSNATLNLIRYLIHPWPNVPAVSVDDIDWERVRDAADIDDKWRGLKDGSRERNHTVDCVILSTEDRTQKVRELLTAMDGLLINDGGAYYTRPGDRAKPRGTITPRMLQGGFDVAPHVPDRDQVNIVKTEFVAPEREYNVVVGPVLKNEGFIAADGAPHEMTLSLPCTRGNARAQRFAKRKMFERRNAGSWSGALTIDCAHYVAGDIVRFADWGSIGFPGVDGEYQVRDVRRDETLTSVQISATRWSNERFAWHAPDEQQDFELDEDVLNAGAA